MRPKPIVGQTLFYQSDYNKHAKLKPMLVVKVGRKYVTAVSPEHASHEHAEAWHWQFALADWKSAERRSGRLVMDEADLLAVRAAEQLEADQKREAETLLKAIRERFNWSQKAPTLDQLRRIKAIIDEGGARDAGSCDC